MKHLRNQYSLVFDCCHLVPAFPGPVGFNIFLNFIFNFLIIFFASTGWLNLSCTQIVPRNVSQKVAKWLDGKKEGLAAISSELLVNYSSLLPLACS